ncbi:MAG: hypothetical protein PVSMB4_10870 [Ktedonobacterales bacterium]
MDSRMVRQHRGVVALALLLGCLVLVAACGGSTGRGASGAPLGGIAGIGQPSASEILAKAKAAQYKDATLTMHISETAGGKESVTTIDLQVTSSPQRVDATTTQPDGSKSEVIVDGAATYYKQHDTWTKLPSQSTSPYRFLTTNYARLIPSATLVGSETINGHPTYHLTATLPAPTPVPGANVTSSAEAVDVWVRQDNYYVAKILAHGTGTFNGQPTTTAFTLLYSTWDTGLTIAVPSVG